MVAFTRVWVVKLERNERFEQYVGGKIHSTRWIALDVRAIKKAQVVFGGKAEASCRNEPGQFA
jgi:hypothetical protein